ncbi:MAG: hypothetical protein Q8P12_04690, partial [bacterium]|nr:hypothetical protein [bacterium]
MAPLYEDALRIKGMAAGTEKEAAKEALRVQMRELESVYSAGRQEMAAFAQAEKAVDAWNTRLAAQDAVKATRAKAALAAQAVKDAEGIVKAREALVGPTVRTTGGKGTAAGGFAERKAAAEEVRKAEIAFQRQQNQAHRDAVSEARRSMAQADLQWKEAKAIAAPHVKAAAKAERDALALAKRDLVVAQKEVRANELAEQKAQTVLARAEKQLSYITDADAHTITKRIQTDEQAAINFLRKQVRSGDIEVEKTLAQNFFDRAKALQSLPDPDRHWAAQQLMNDIAKIVPPTAWDNTLNALGLARSLKASMDLSFPLRQGAFQWTRKEWRSMFGEQIRAFASEDVARAAENRILFGQFGKVRAASGLEFVDRNGALYQMEETFFSKWIQKEPTIPRTVPV